MDKQGFIVIALILLAWVGYQTLVIAPQQKQWQDQLLKYQEQERRKAEEEAKKKGNGGVAAPDTATQANGAPPADAPAEPEQDRPRRDLPKHERVSGIAFDTGQHTIELTTRGASLETLTFKDILNTPYVAVAPAGYDERSREPLMLLRPFKGIDLGSFALEPLERALAQETHADWAYEKVGDAHRFTLRLSNGLELVKTYAPPQTPTPVENGGAPDAKAPPLYHFDLTVEVKNPTNHEVEFGYRLLGPAGMVEDSGDTRTGGLSAAVALRSAAPDEEDEVELFLHTAADLAKPDGAKTDDAQQRELTFYGLTSKYFAAVLIPRGEARLEGVTAQTLLQADGKPAAAAENDPLRGQVAAWARTGFAKLAPGASRTDTYQVYVGPKAKAVFEAEGTPYVKKKVVSDGKTVDLTLGLQQLVNFGWFEFMARILLKILSGFHAVVGNWGVSIILLTFLVRTLLLPLSLWSQKNMLRMQKMAPELNKLKEKYSRKDGSMTPEAQRQFSMEQMELMRKTGVNPVGCIGPIFLQFPVFIGLWNALNYSFELRGQPFALWINDLSVPDVLFRLGPITLPLLGTNAFSVLPLLMVFTYWLTQKLQPVPTDPRAAEQARMMKWILPIFGFMLYTSPSGLMLYFITSSVWSMVEMKQVKKYIEKTEGPLPAGAAAPVMP